MQDGDSKDMLAIGVVGALVVSGAIFYLTSSKAYDSMKAVPLNVLVAELSKRLK